MSVGTFAQVFGGGTYSELFWAIGIMLILQVVLSFTRWGVYTVAVGGNRVGAAEAGVRTRVVLTRNFVMCALLAGFVGILEAVRAATTTPDPSGSNAILFQVDLRGGHRRHAAAGRIGHRDRSVHRRDLPRHPPGRARTSRASAPNHYLFYLGLAC